MARQVTVQLQAGGQSLVPGDDFLHFSLTQRLAGHHSFLLSVPFDRVEGPQTAFFTRAPEQLLGQALTVNLQADEAFHFNGAAELRFKGLITGLGTSQELQPAGRRAVRAALHAARPHHGRDLHSEPRPTPRGGLRL